MASSVWTGLCLSAVLLPHDDDVRFLRQCRWKHDKLLQAVLVELTFCILVVNPALFCLNAVFGQEKKNYISCFA